MKDNPKREQQRAIARESSIKAFGVPLSVRDAIIKIQRNEGRFIGRLTRRVSLWELVLRGRTVTVAYDKNRQMVIKFMRPREQWPTM